MLWLWNCEGEGLTLDPAACVTKCTFHQKALKTENTAQSRMIGSDRKRRSEVEIINFNNQRLKETVTAVTFGLNVVVLLRLMQRSKHTLAKYFI